MKPCFSRSCTIILVALCVLMPALAEEVPQQDCGPLCVCVSDVRCREATGCDLIACDSTEFTIECTSGGMYKFDVAISCANCVTCIACAFLVGPGFSSSLQAGCVAGQCSQGTVVHLAGGTYKLYACLQLCPGHTCSECSGCVAKARVCRNVSDCTAPCNW